nr:hypothetical protein BgiMline_004537 [Biomphalaria glabrata]
MSRRMDWNSIADTFGVLSSFDISVCPATTLGPDQAVWPVYILRQLCVPLQPFALKQNRTILHHHCDVDFAVFRASQ